MRRRNRNQYHHQAAANNQRQRLENHAMRMLGLAASIAPN
jgi:hypothetical protein